MCILTNRFLIEEIKQTKNNFRNLLNTNSYIISKQKIHNKLSKKNLGRGSFAVGTRLLTSLAMGRRPKNLTLTSIGTHKGSSQTKELGKAKETETIQR